MLISILYEMVLFYIKLTRKSNCIFELGIIYETCNTNEIKAIRIIKHCKKAIIIIVNDNIKSNSN